MPIVSKLNYLRISPRKVRLVADLIRNNKVEQAERILNFTIKRAAGPLAKLLKTAIADAHNNFHIDSDNLYISKIIVNEGPRYKRWRPRSRGMANKIEKRTSHITLVLGEISPREEDKASIKKERVSRRNVGTRKEVPPVKKLKTKKEKEVLKDKKEDIAESPAGSGKSGIKIRQPKQRPETELLKHKPKDRGGLRRIFRRKAI
jgi:large subunit ribosomal protein L22